MESIVYSRILKTFVLPLSDRVMQTSISSMYKQIREMQCFEPEKIEAWQNEQLKLLLEHAYNNTAYYNQVFRSAGVLPKDIRTQKDLRQLPVLTKSIIKENLTDLIPENIQSIPHKKSATGGSTGSPLNYLLDKKSWSYATANKIFNWEKVGYNYGDKFIALGSTSLFVDKKKSIRHKLYYNLKGKIGLNGVNMSDATCDHYLDIIKKRKIRFIYGYASAIYILARYAIKNEVKVLITACFPTSEVLTSNYRNVIVEAFKCEVMDGYGAGDGGITAFSKEPGYFEVGHNCIVRLEEQNKNQTGSAILTDLYNYAMPFINYEIGDELITDTGNHINYRYNGQLINQVLGRSSDILDFDNGHTITGPGFTILFKDIPVDYYCIEKKSGNSLVCWIIKLPSFTKDHNDLIYNTIRKQVGEDVSVVIRPTDHPFLSDSGKRQYFIDLR